MTKTKAVLASVLMCLVFFAANSLIVYRVLHAWKDYAYQVVLVHDIMGIYSLTGRNYLHEDYLSQNTMNRLMKKYDHRISDPTTFVQGFPYSTDARRIADLRRQWWNAVLQNPGAYLTHRWILYRSFLTNFERTLNPIQPVSDPPPPVLAKMPSPLMKETDIGKMHTRFILWTLERYPFLYEALSYVIAGVVVLLISWRWRVLKSLALSASSLIYIGSYFLLAPGVHFRYLYWPVFATLLSLVILWFEKPENSATVKH